MNRADREIGAQLIERWFQGAITNYEFDDAWPWESPDKALSETGHELWCYFDDDVEHVLTISGLSTEQMDVVKRCYDFLKSDSIYQYEVYPKPKTLLGKLKAPFTKQTVQITDEERAYWPFRSLKEREQQQHALPGVLRA